MIVRRVKQIIKSKVNSGKPPIKTLKTIIACDEANTMPKNTKLLHIIIHTHIHPDT